MKITSETLASSINVAWEISHDAHSVNAWRYRWNRTANELYGMLRLMEVTSSSEEILDDCKLLIAIASSHSMSKLGVMR